MQEIGGRIRALWIGFQQKLGRTLDAKERIAAFIPEYAAYLLNHLLIGEGGKVPVERSKGKRRQIVGLEFGEKLLYHKRKAPRRQRWNLGGSRGYLWG